MKVDCYPISLLPRQTRLFLDYAASREPIAPFYVATPWSQEWKSGARQQDAGLRTTVADALREQNMAWGAGAKTLENIERLRHGAGAVVTGQQVALFGGPLFTVLKAATIIQRAQAAGAVPVFWLASEDHDLAEADHITLPGRHALRTLHLERDQAHGGQPVGSLTLGPHVTAVVDRAAELIGGTPEFDLLASSYTPDATFTAAFARLLAGIFADHGLVVIDASTRVFHGLGAPVLRYAIEHAADLETALHQRDLLLAERGYHAQVLVAAGSSLLFLIDEETGARLPLRRKNGSWIAGRETHSAEDLLRILDEKPERLSPNALLRPVFQDFVLPTMAMIGGPAEVAYFAQSQVIYEAIPGRTTPIFPRLSATLIEPAVAEIMAQHDLTLADILENHADELADRLGARAIPIEGKKRLAATGNALDAELEALLAWTQSLDAGLGKAAGVAASKMRYQMNRLRRLAAHYQLQQEASLRRHVDTLSFNLFPDRHPQERVIGGIAYLARYGTALVDTLVEQATQDCPGHKAVWL